MTLVIPYWSQRPWFPGLLDLVVVNTMALPACPDLSSHPHFHRRHLGIHRLSLHAWRLSSILQGLKVSLSEWLLRLGMLAGVLREPIITLNGLFLVSGVGPTDILFLVPLSP